MRTRFLIFLTVVGLAEIYSFIAVRSALKPMPGVWRTISRVNPILYMINGFRYGFYGFSDVNILLSFLILILFAAIFTAVIFYFLGKGTGLRS